MIVEGELKTEMSAKKLEEEEKVEGVQMRNLQGRL